MCFVCVFVCVAGGVSIVVDGVQRRTSCYFVAIVCAIVCLQIVNDRCSIKTYQVITIQGQRNWMMRDEGKYRRHFPCMCVLQFQNINLGFGQMIPIKGHKMCTVYVYHLPSKTSSNILQIPPKCLTMISCRLSQFLGV